MGCEKCPGGTEGLGETGVRVAAGDCTDCPVNWFSAGAEISPNQDSRVLLFSARLGKISQFDKLLMFSGFSSLVSPKDNKSKARAAFFLTNP